MGRFGAKRVTSISEYSGQDGCLKECVKYIIHILNALHRICVTWNRSVGRLNGLQVGIPGFRFDNVRIKDPTDTIRY